MKNHGPFLPKLNCMLPSETGPPLSQRMDNSEVTPAVRRSTSLKLTLTTESSTKGCTPLKRSFSQAVRDVLSLRRPAHKRASSTGNTGFVLPGDQSTTASSSRTTSDLRPDSVARSVLSLQSVHIFGPDPSILLTLPSNRGRQTHMLHRGGHSTSPSPVARLRAKHLRFSHPLVSAVKVSSIASSEQLSDVTAPPASELYEYFPGEVNIYTIANRADITLEDAKDKLDGIKRDDEFIVLANRAAALEALDGVSEAPVIVFPSSLPQCLVPGGLHRRAVTLASADMAAEGMVNTQMFSRKTARPRHVSRPSLDFIPYSKFFGELTAVPEKTKAVPDRKSAALSLRHSQLYASVEGLSEDYPEFDNALLAAECIAPLKMVDNGYPVFPAGRISFSAQPAYHKRAAPSKELRDAQKACKAHIPVGEYNAVKKVKRSSFFGRFRQMIAV